MQEPGNSQSIVLRTMTCCSLDTSVTPSDQSVPQLGLGSSKLALSHNHLIPVFTPDHVQDHAIIDDRQNAHDLTDPSSRLSHADKLANREEWLHHVFQSRREPLAQV
jgi:hypothetical protein